MPAPCQERKHSGTFKELSDTVGMLVNAMRGTVPIAGSDGLLQKSHSYHADPQIKFIINFLYFMINDWQMTEYR